MENKSGKLCAHGVLPGTEGISFISENDRDNAPTTDLRGDRSTALRMVSMMLSS